ncbi:unnamed protein product [Linum tenue]|uniref:Uncharacterized protein n=1 Tax=Linum tenue TaxID=586396 RepID=A0AAV0KD65_9ROSI|nr:unnamed protein product [Linum tenue]CAI0420060.1 unnamed protein product [Linum tenue]
MARSHHSRQPPRPPRSRSHNQPALVHPHRRPSRPLPREAQNPGDWLGDRPRRDSCCGRAGR